mgnify:CR=1 FL=1
MAAKKIHTTPKGEAQWPKLFVPDTKFVAGGEYSMKLIIREDAAESLMEMLDAEASTQYNKAVKQNPKKKAKITKRTPYELEVDDEGDETGNVEFKFKMKANVELKNGDSFSQKPAVFDAKGRPIIKEISIGSGSIMRAGFELVPYFMSSTNEASVSLRLKSAQLIDLVEYSSASNPFGEEEGYTVEDNEDENDSPFSEESGGYNSEEDDEDF